MSRGQRRREDGAAQPGMTGRQRFTFPRWFRVGPGLLLALVVSFFVWRQMPPMSSGRSAGGPSRIERTRVETASGTPLTAPDPAWLLAQRGALGLNAVQVQKLKKRKVRWDRDTQALRAALEGASTEFSQSIGATGAQGVSLEALREQAVPVSALSRELREARSAWWNDAASVLTAAQRQQAERAWGQRLVPRAARQQKENDRP